MAKIHPHRQNGVQIGFIADLGKQPGGKRLKRFFKTYAEAESFIGSHQKDPTPTGELFDRKNEILDALDRCKRMGVTLRTVVDFYEVHGVKKVTITIRDAITNLLADKAKVDRKEVYLKKLQFSLNKFADYTNNAIISDITKQQVDDYIYKQHEHVNAVSKLNILRNLSVLFNYGLKQHYCAFNPAENIDKPQVQWKKPEVLSPEDMTTLLNRCFKKGWYDRITMFVLVGFCGVRTEEASKLTWTDIDLESGKVLVPADVAKKLRFRRNVIPPNAMAWLKAIEDKRRTGPIIGDNWVALLRSAVKYSHIKHTKNCLRHSFCSYALEAGWPLADVIAYLGHSGSPAVIANNYRNVVEKKDANAWWSIIPPV